MKGIYITPNCELSVKEISGVSTIQNLVGGFIETLHSKKLGNKFKVIVNEEGAIYGMPLNQVGTHLMKTPVVGPIVILGVNRRTENLVGLTDKEIKRLSEMLRR